MIVQKLFIPLLIASFLIAAWEVIGLMTGHPNYFWPAEAWLAVFLIAAIAFKWRAVTFLIGAPFALGPPILIWLYVASCAPTKSCL